MLNQCFRSSDVKNSRANSRVIDQTGPAPRLYCVRSVFLIAYLTRLIGVALWRRKVGRMRSRTGFPGRTPFAIVTMFVLCLLSHLRYPLFSLLWDIMNASRLRFSLGFKRNINLVPDTWWSQKVTYHLSRLTDYCAIKRMRLLKLVLINFVSEPELSC